MGCKGAVGSPLQLGVRRAMWKPQNDWTQRVIGRIFELVMQILIFPKESAIIWLKVGFISFVGDLSTPCGGALESRRSFLGFFLTGLFGALGLGFQSVTVSPKFGARVKYVFELPFIVDEELYFQTASKWEKSEEILRVFESMTREGKILSRSFNFLGKKVEIEYVFSSSADVDLWHKTLKERGLFSRSNLLSEGVSFSVERQILLV